MANRMELTASFIAAPAPGPPTSITRSPMPRSTGRAAANGCGSPAAMIISVPASAAATTLPDTGASTRWAPMSASRRRASVVYSTPDVPMSITMSPAERSASSPPPPPSTSSRAGLVGQHRDDHRAALRSRHVDW